MKAKGRRRGRRQFRSRGRVPAGGSPGGRRVTRLLAAERGVALILVLVVATLLGLAALSLSFIVALDTLAAGHVQETALAEGQAEGALALAVWTAATSTDEPPASTGRYGPWPDLGITAHADVLWDGTGTVEFRSRAENGRSSVTRTLVARLRGGAPPLVLVRP